MSGVRVRWSKREGALLYTAEPCTGGWLAYHFEQAMTNLGVPMAKELDARGYDLTTLRFSIQRKATQP